MFCRVTHVQAPEGKVNFQTDSHLWYENILPITKIERGLPGSHLDGGLRLRQGALDHPLGG